MEISVLTVAQSSRVLTGKKIRITYTFPGIIHIVVSTLVTAMSFNGDCWHNLNIHANFNQSRQFGLGFGIGLLKKRKTSEPKVSPPKFCPKSENPRRKGGLLACVEAG